MGQYKLIEVVADGGAGTVFKAEHGKIGRQVAIKLLHPDLVESPMVLKRFFAEAQAVNRIKHPNIVDITDFVEGHKHPPYMVMELLEGEDVREHLVTRRTIPVEEVVAIAVQVCDALHTVHETGIVHRDLKAENVFLIERPGQPPKVKLLDFGIAKWLTLEDSYLRTRTGEIVGTPEYMAPEQILEQTVDRRTDIYAMGVLLYEMLTGELPFPYSEVPQLLRKHLQEIPLPPSDRLTEKGKPPLPPGMDRVVLKCLAKRKVNRFPDMKQLEGALLGCLPK